MKKKGECEGDKNNCNQENCPIYGSLRLYSDGVYRVYLCDDRPKGMKKSKVNAFSEKTKSQMKDRELVRIQVLLRDHMQCTAKHLVASIECFGPLDVDEIIPRGRGGSHLDADNCQVLCRAHHRWKHDNPAEAERLGLTKRLPPR